ncbi:MAG: 23S rRNA (pseudouridine(1915)-N(3))-methyltransferase RlmH [Rhodobacterales bacterium]|nr:23S rRNA (pseudouridine(1915)-N(3))-methyltransferase RlmH [Rhodobacterales bacterium]
MRLHICAVGRMRAGPERAIFDNYMLRAERTGRALGLGAATLHEVEDKKGGGLDAEAALLERALPQGAVRVALDERGRLLTSPDFAARVADWRDMGRSDLAFIIGGADGIAPFLRETADFTLSLGKMVWPHMLARVMLAEQIYRATTILTGGPYHRT